MPRALVAEIHRLHVCGIALFPETPLQLTGLLQTLERAHLNRVVAPLIQGNTAGCRRLGFIVSSDRDTMRFGIALLFSLGSHDGGLTAARDLRRSSGFGPGRSI